MAHADVAIIAADASLPDRVMRHYALTPRCSVRYHPAHAHACRLRRCSGSSTFSLMQR